MTSRRSTFPPPPALRHLLRHGEPYNGLVHLHDLVADNPPYHRAYDSKGQQIFFFPPRDQLSHKVLWIEDDVTNNTGIVHRVRLNEEGVPKARLNVDAVTNRTVDEKKGISLRACVKLPRGVAHNTTPLALKIEAHPACRQLTTPAKEGSDTLLMAKAHNAPALEAVPPVPARPGLKLQAHHRPVS